MDEERQILFMQIRMLRLAAERLQLSLKEAAELFEKFGALAFIRDGFGIFHVEGDEAVYDELCQYLKSKGAAL